VSRKAHEARYEYHFGMGDPDTSNPYSTSWPLHKYPDHRVVQKWKVNDDTFRDDQYFGIEGPGFSGYDAFDSPHEAASHFAQRMGYEQSPVSGAYRKRKR